MISRDSYDVIVVGGRVAGASTALLLARAGARVLVIERSRYGSDALSTHGLMRAGTLQLSRWGVLDRIVAAGTPPVRRTTFRSAGEDPIHITIRPSTGVPALYAPRRYLLDRLLVDAAREAGAEFRHGTRVTGVVRDDAGRVRGVRIADGTGRRGDRTMTARYVVGADGIRSVVADAVGSRVTHSGRNASALRYAYFNGFDTAGYEWAYGDGAAAGLIPTNDGLHCVFVGSSPDRMRSLRTGRSANEHFQTVFRLAAADQVERLTAAERVSRIHGWAGATGYLRRPWGPGWVLVGDSGYFTDPISTHGITDALRDSELASRAILSALDTGRPEAEAQAFGDYHQQRDALSVRLFRVADEIASFDWRGATVQPLLRRLSAAMTDEVEVLESLPPPAGRDLAVEATPAGSGPSPGLPA